MNHFRLRLRKITPWRAIAGYYFIAVFISVLLLSLPPVYQPGVQLSFIDTLFTAVSAVSVTGLTVIDISETFSTFGIFVFLFILQFGGIGVMSVGTFFWLLFGRKIGLKARQLIMVDHNQMNLSGLVTLIKEILKILLLVELLGTIILGFHFLKYFPTANEAFFHGLFISISATTNAGFSLMDGSIVSLSGDYFVQVIITLLIIFGAIGFPVLVEVKKFFRFRKKKAQFRFSLFSKLTTITFFALLAAGTAAILLLEWRYAFSGASWHQSFFYAYFQSVTSRSAGLSTIDINEFSRSTLLVLALLMFIGASPSSVGGGIRTTTFALNALFLYHFIKGNKSIMIFNREVHEEDLVKSLAVTLMAVLLVFISVIILSISENQPLFPLVFEVCSAFGTTGLSMGITGELTILGKMIIMILMFIGRIGLSSFLFMIGGKGDKVNYRCPKEHVIVG